MNDYIFIKTGCRMAKERSYSGPCLPIDKEPGCPFLKCLQEMTAKERHFQKLEERDKRIRTAKKNGESVKQLAHEYKLSTYMIYKIIGGKH